MTWCGSVDRLSTKASRNVSSLDMVVLINQCDKIQTKVGGGSTHDAKMPWWMETREANNRRLKFELF